MADPRQPITPLRFDTPIVDPAKGTPTSQFVRLWQQLFGNETGTNEGLAAVEATANAAQLTADTAQADVDAAELDIGALQLAAVPTGGALGEVLTKDSATDYDMSWQPPAGGGGGSSPFDAPVTKPLSANFTAVNGATFADTSTGMFVSGVNGAGGQIRYAAQTAAIPAGDFTATMRGHTVTNDFATNSYSNGIYLRNTSTGRVVLFSIWNANQVLVQNWNSVSSFNSTLALLNTNGFWMPWKRIRKVSGDLFFESSPDGESWTQIATATVASFITTIDEAGVGNMFNAGPVSPNFGTAVQSWAVV